MNNNKLILISLLFLGSILLMPLAMPNCGINGFYAGPPEDMAGSCHETSGLTHFSEMINFLLSGNLSLLVIVILILPVLLIIEFKQIKTIKLPQLANVFSRIVVGRLKPFDEILMALKKGIIQPKTFCFA